MSHRSAYCLVSISPVRAEKRDASEMVTQLLFGELVTIEETELPWIRIKTYADNYEGFVDHKHLRLLSPKELNRWLDGLGYQRQLYRNIETPWGMQRIYRGSFVPVSEELEFNIGNDLFSFQSTDPVSEFKDPYSFACEFLNTPYLWGGKTPCGIDCSGLTQTVFRFFEYNLPRDASQQVEYGIEVDIHDTERGDLAFFSNKDGRVIHVGILDGQGKIVHASGQVRIDSFTEEGIIHSETGEKTHTLHSVRRL